MRKNHELFWIFELLFLTPIAMFWLGVMSMYLGSNNLFRAVVGQPLDPIKAILVAILCPAAAAWFAYDYLRENKNDKRTEKKIAKYIITISLATILVVIIYLYGQNSPR